MDLKGVIKKLNEEQKKELLYLLYRDLNAQGIMKPIAEMSMLHPINCPHCQGANIYRHGRYKGRNRYKCMSCNKTFNDRTGSTIDGIKKMDKFRDYLILIIENTSIRQASNALGVNVKTVFDWRHKLLSHTKSNNYLSILKDEDL